MPRQPLRISVIRTTADGRRELREYEIDPAVVSVVIDADHVHGEVWGFTDREHLGRQYDANLIRQDDDFIVIG